jgi:hypothetical protein
MMPNGWGFFPWPVLFMFIIPMMIVMAVLMAVWMSHRRGSIGPGCGVAAPPVRSVGPVASLPVEDPMVTLRERLVRGEIGIPEFEARLESLLRSDPHQSTPW